MINTEVGHDSTKDEERRKSFCLQSEKMRRKAWSVAHFTENPPVDVYYIRKKFVIFLKAILHDCSIRVMNQHEMYGEPTIEKNPGETQRKSRKE